MQSQLKELLDMMSTDTYITAKDISSFAKSLLSTTTPMIKAVLYPKN